MAKTPGAISEHMIEVNRRLQEKDNQKARDLLATAMGHFHAMKHLKDVIEQKVKESNGTTKPV